MCFFFFLEKHCRCSRAFIYGLILTLLHTNMKYDNILNTFEFEGFRAKIKITVAIFKKHYHRSIAFICGLILI